MRLSSKILIRAFLTVLAASFPLSWHVMGFFAAVGITVIVLLVAAAISCAVWLWADKVRTPQSEAEIFVAAQRAERDRELEPGYRVEGSSVVVGKERPLREDFVPSDKGWTAAGSLPVLESSQSIRSNAGTRKILGRLLIASPFLAVAFLFLSLLKGLFILLAMLFLAIGVFGGIALGLHLVLPNPRKEEF